ncbi:MAG TPA: methyltransferase domain-containing protein [Kofleriaceae bacterium]
MAWSATQYSKFENERNRPIRDLIAQLSQERVATAVDLGCGPGNSTELLATRFPDATIIGIDTSTDMLDAARLRLPKLRFELEDIATWAAPGPSDGGASAAQNGASSGRGRADDLSGLGPYDILFANAALQWVPDHARLLPALIGKLAPHGCLAVQVPDNLDEPAHRLMREVAADGPWAAKLVDAAGSRAPRHDPTWYVRALQPHVASVDIWRTTYHHPLTDAAAIVEWFRGSGLRPFLDPLDAGERTAYLERYTAAITTAYPALPDGSVLLPFPRLFFVATR